MIGGSGKMMLNLAGKCADIVNLFVGLQTGWTRRRRTVLEGARAID